MSKRLSKKERKKLKQLRRRERLQKRKREQEKVKEFDKNMIYLFNSFKGLNIKDDKYDNENDKYDEYIKICKVFNRFII